MGPVYEGDASVQVHRDSEGKLSGWRDERGGGYDAEQPPPFDQVVGQAEHEVGEGGEVGTVALERFLEHGDDVDQQDGADQDIMSMNIAFLSNMMMDRPTADEGRFTQMNADKTVVPRLCLDFSGFLCLISQQSQTAQSYDYCRAFVTDYTYRHGDIS